MIKFTITENVSEQVDGAFKELEVSLGRVFAGMVEEAFVQLVFETPQWSGMTAASWNMTVNRASYKTASRNDFPFTNNPYQKGDLPAIMHALNRAQGKSATFKDRFEARGWIIEVNNGVEYAADMNDGNMNLRAEVGHSPGFFDRFQDRVNTAQADDPITWNYYANTDFLGGASA